MKSFLSKRVLLLSKVNQYFNYKYDNIIKETIKSLKENNCEKRGILKRVINKANSLRVNSIIRKEI